MRIQKERGRERLKREERKENKVHQKACSKEKVDLPLHSLSEKKAVLRKEVSGQIEKQALEDKRKLSLKK